MTRVLATTERHVHADAREAYFAELQQRRVVFEEAHVHFWVFEHAIEDGRFIEFAEGADVLALASALGGSTPANVWREVQRG